MCVLLRSKGGINAIATNLDNTMLVTGDSGQYTKLVAGDSGQYIYWSLETLKTESRSSEAYFLSNKFSCCQLRAPVGINCCCCLVLGELRPFALSQTATSACGTSATTAWTTTTRSNCRATARRNTRTSRSSSGRRCYCRAATGRSSSAASTQTVVLPLPSGIIVAAAATGLMWIHLSGRMTDSVWSNTVISVCCCRCDESALADVIPRSHRGTDVSAVPAAWSTGLHCVG